MSIYGAAAMTGVRAVALIGILPGAIVAGAYLLVLTGQLYQHWDVRTAVVLGMAAWGVVGVVELWHEYVRLSDPPVSPRALLFVWALILLIVAGWKVDERPWAAAFLALVALYSLARALGLLKYVARRRAASGRERVAGSSRGARPRGSMRSRARNPGRRPAGAAPPQRSNRRQGLPPPLS
jgi:hypothetical protein